jgi:hypothetical protein
MGSRISSAILRRRDFSLFHSIQTSLEAKCASNSMGATDVKLISLTYIQR